MIGGMIGGPMPGGRPRMMSMIAPALMPVVRSRMKLRKACLATREMKTVGNGNMPGRRRGLLLGGTG